MKRVAYFGHSRLLFNTRREREIRDYLEDTWNLKVICPARDINVYVPRKTSSIYANHLKLCDILVIVEHEECIGYGVFTEVKHAMELNMPVLLLRSHGSSFYLTIVTEVYIYNMFDYVISYGKVRIKEGGLANDARIKELLRG